MQGVEAREVLDLVPCHHARLAVQRQRLRQLADSAAGEQHGGHFPHRTENGLALRLELQRERDRKSTRMNSSHSQISYAVFCLKKKKNTSTHATLPRGTRRTSRNRSCS